MFRAISKDGANNAIFIQGAQSKSPGSNIASIVFQNYDDDSKITYNMGSIAIRDHFGNSNQDGFGDLIFLTRNTQEDPKALTEQARLTYDGNLGIGTPTPTHRLHVDGSLYVTGSIVAPNIDIASSNVFFPQLQVDNLVPALSDTVQASNLSVHDLTITNTLVQKITPLYNSAFTFKPTALNVFSPLKTFSGVAGHTGDAIGIESIQCTAYIVASQAQYALRLFNLTQNAVLATQSALSNETPQLITLSVPVLTDISTIPGDILEFQVSATSTASTVYIDNLSISYIL
jgi:hypothetical protein